MSWFEVRDKCEIVEQIENRFFEIDEEKVKERSRDWARTAKFMTHVRINGEVSPSQNTYYRIW